MNIPFTFAFFSFFISAVTWIDLIISLLKGRKILVTPNYMLTEVKKDSIYYDLGLQRELNEEVFNTHREDDQTIRKIFRISNIFGSVSAAIVGLVGDQAYLGVTVGVACAALSYVANTTNIFKKPYYKRKIDEGIQRVIDEYESPKPNNPIKPLQIA